MKSFIERLIIMGLSLTLFFFIFAFIVAYLIIQII